MIANRSLLRPVIALLLLLLAITGCGPTMIESTWLDHEISIDGADTHGEWNNAQYTFDEKKVSLGLMNSASHLYLRLSSRDRAIQRQVLVGGLTVWFNPDGTDNKALGIRFPLPSPAGGRMIPSSQSGGENGRSSPADGGRGETPPDSGNMEQDGRNRSEARQMLFTALTTVEILGPGENGSVSLSCAQADSTGIVARIGFTGGNLVYELSIPLVRTAETPVYIAESSMPEFVGIGFQTGTIAIPERRSDSGQRSRGGMGGGMGGMGRGGMGGGMGDMGGGRGGGPGGEGRSAASKPFALWVKARTIAVF